MLATCITEQRLNIIIQMGDFRHFHAAWCPRALSCGKYDQWQVDELVTGTYYPFILLHLEDMKARYFLYLHIYYTCICLFPIVATRKHGK